jgi:hypothetical protein
MHVATQFQFAASQVLRACDAWGPDLLFLPPDIEGIQRQAFVALAKSGKSQVCSQARLSFLGRHRS